MRDILKSGYRRFWFCTLATLACMLFPYILALYLTSLAAWWWLGFAAMLVLLVTGPWIFGFARLKCSWCGFRFRASSSPTRLAQESLMNGKCVRIAANRCIAKLSRRELYNAPVQLGAYQFVVG